ncbi:MAG: hypothetical protein ACYTG1_11995 [Planctomycetota bacterium]
MSWRRIRPFSSTSYGGRFATDSIHDWSHRRFSRSWMCMYSTPMWRQYVSRRTATTSRSGESAGSGMCPGSHGVSRSASLRPNDSSRS